MLKIIYLGGDSYPSDVACEAMVNRALTSSLKARFISQNELISPESMKTEDWKPIPFRLRQLETLIDSFWDRNAVLIGRSSGGRIATTFAKDHEIRAVVCFAYPFQPPDHNPEASRYMHLADLQVPTLIIQGTRDSYGGSEVIRRYAFSPSIQLHFIDADHDFVLTPEVWKELFTTIHNFILQTKKPKKKWGLSLIRLFTKTS